MGWSDRQEVEFRGSLANVNLALLPDDLLQRIADGEHPMAVLANALDRGIPRDALLGLPAASEEDGEAEHSNAPD